MLTHRRVGRRINGWIACAESKLAVEEADNKVQGPEVRKRIENELSIILISRNKTRYPSTNEHKRNQTVFTAKK